MLAGIVQASITLIKMQIIYRVANPYGELLLIERRVWCTSLRAISGHCFIRVWNGAKQPEVPPNERQLGKSSSNNGTECTQSVRIKLNFILPIGTRREQCIDMKLLKNSLLLAGLSVTS